MKRLYPACYVVVGVLVFVPVGLRVLNWQQTDTPAADPDAVRAGEVLFKHEWQPNDPLCGGGDGLGPVFNAKSCVACHNQGGVGGSGAIEHNVTVFAVDPQRAGQKGREGVIHNFALSAPFKETLANVHPALPRVAPPVRLRPARVAVIHQGHHGLNFRGGPIRAVNIEFNMANLPEGVHLSQRRTPALFGAGLIDAIPDRILIAQARRERLRQGMAKADSDTVPVGRVSRLPDGKIGRFGGKAQTASLSDFVQAACASELGLGNPGQPQPASLASPDYRAVGPDLTQRQCDQITAFVASLRRPVERLPADAAHRSQAGAGKGLFNKVGCADCHTPSLGSVEGLFSDLLLHRMGEDLSGAGTSYGGPAVPPEKVASENGPLPDEWRTPPLWGVADSGPYLHDGRAKTLEDAIDQHGGQAGPAAARFRALPPSEQAQLVAFLRTLRAP
jgi:CxxC motif-containing protein (DUF1111 family)